MAQWSQKNLLKSYTTSISREKSLETNVSELIWAETEVNKMKKSLRARMQLDFYRTPIQINFQEINNIWFLKGSERDLKKTFAGRFISWHRVVTNRLILIFSIFLRLISFLMPFLQISCRFWPHCVAEVKRRLRRHYRRHCDRSKQESNIHIVLSTHFFSSNRVVTNRLSSISRDFFNTNSCRFWSHCVAEVKTPVAATL